MYNPNNRSDTSSANLAMLVVMIGLFLLALVLVLGYVAPIALHMRDALAGVLGA